MQGALAFQKGLGCVHSLSHALGGINPRLHHGTLNAMFLPAVLAFNAEAPSVVAERRMERLAAAMGLPDAPAIGQAVRELNQRLGLPRGLERNGRGRIAVPAHHRACAGRPHPQDQSARSKPGRLCRHARVVDVARRPGAARNAAPRPDAQGQCATFCWDLNERTRAFAQHLLRDPHPATYPMMDHAGATRGRCIS